MVFCKTKVATQKLAKQLECRNIKSDAIHGDLLQKERDRAMRAFKNESLQILISTDIAARGIDVADLSFVVHYQLPDKPEYYTHRSGRTARAGKTGRVVTLATHKEQRTVGGITRRAGVEPWVMAIKPLDEKLVSITGAKKPTGIPVQEVKEKAPAMPRHKSAKHRAKQVRNRNKFTKSGMIEISCSLRDMVNKELN